MKRLLIAYFRRFACSSLDKLRKKFGALSNLPRRCKKFFQNTTSFSF